MTEEHINPLLVKSKAMSEQGKKMSKELEDLNWVLQEIVFNHMVIKAEYDYKSLKYKKFLGYSVSDEDIKKAEKEYNDLVNIKEDK